MAQTDGAASRLVKGMTLLASLVGLAFGFVSPSDVTRD